MSEAQRIDQERKSLRKKQIISGMIEDSMLQRSLKKERHKLRDFAQQTQGQDRQVKYSARVRRFSHGNLGGFRNVSGQPGKAGAGPGGPVFQGGAGSAREYGKGLTRSASGAFRSTTSTSVSNIKAEVLQDKQKWTTSGYRSEGGDPNRPLFKGWEMEAPKKGSTSESRRVSRKRLKDAATGRQFKGTADQYGGKNLGETGHMQETNEERKAFASSTGSSYRPERSAAGSSYGNLGLGR
jgi:hypothetical protein